MWTEKEIEEGKDYGVNLFNWDGKKMLQDMCEICHESFVREVTEDVFPRYCLKCIEANPDSKLNEIRHK